MMSDGSVLGANTARRAQLIRTLGLVAGLWIASDVGYYLLLPALGLRRGYNAAPMEIAAYYGFCSMIAVIVFRRLFRQWATFENRLSAYILLSVSFGIVVVFTAFLLPLLPPINWRESWEPPELMVATPWYFLPKSIEILFQQLLIVAAVLAFSAQQYSLRTISIVCALLFGGTHVLLAYGGMPFGYVARFIGAAMVFGFVFPYLILRLRNGFAYSYLTHWLYYAITVILAHTISPYAT